MTFSAICKSDRSEGLSDRSVWLRQGPFPELTQNGGFWTIYPKLFHSYPLPSPRLSRTVTVCVLGRGFQLHGAVF